MIDIRQLIIPLGILATAAAEPPEQPRELLGKIDNGSVEVAIDRARGAAITHLTWEAYPQNAVNSYDPGRLIQQSYYSGKRLDRRAEGQHQAWSPWNWNPIQGGGIASWARVPVFRKPDAHTLYSETVPKLWDMPDEDADAVMRQWTGVGSQLMEDITGIRGGKFFTYVQGKTNTVRFSPVDQIDRLIETILNNAKDAQIVD